MPLWLNDHEFNCKNYEIDLELINRGFERVRKISDNKYKMFLFKESDRHTIKHELYHIEDRHFIFTKEEYKKLNFGEKLLDWGNFLFLQEPQAEIYAITGLKL